MAEIADLISTIRNENIKIDIDGNEKDLILGAEKTFESSSLKSILIELNEKDENFSFIVDHIKNKKFKKYLEDNPAKALINISHKVDIVLVVGSSTSSNTNALVTTINNLGKDAYRIETLDDLRNLNYL